MPNTAALFAAESRERGPDLTGTPVSPLSVTYRYRAYGLALESRDPIPGLEPRSADEPPDVVIRFLAHAPLPDRGPIDVDYFLSSLRNDQGDPMVRVRSSSDRRQYRIEFDDGTQFLICDGASEVVARWSPPLTTEDTATYLMGPVLAFVLQLRDRVCLHASAVAIGDSAVAFVGPSGAGKSTLASALVARGLRVVTEDILPVRLVSGRVWVDPGGPLIRLWQSSVDSLFGAPDAMPLLTPNWDKRFQPLSEASGSFMPSSCLLRAIYLLSPRQPGRSQAAISPASSRDALMALVSNTYGSQLLRPEMRAREFLTLGELLTTVPVRTLEFGDGFEYLPDVCADLLRDIQRLDTSTPVLP